MKTAITIGIVAVAALAAYYIYTKNQQTMATNTISAGGTVGGVSLGGNLNLGTLVSELGGLFGGGGSSDDSGD